MERKGKKARRGRPSSVFDLLARIGQTGTQDEVWERVMDAAIAAGVDVDSIIEPHLPSSPPPCGSAAWYRVREQSLAAVVTRLADEGRLDCISGPDSPRIEGGGMDRHDEAIPGLGVEVTRAITRRADRNGPGCKFRAVRRETPVQAIRRWLDDLGLDVSREEVSRLAETLRSRGLTCIEEDGNIHGIAIIASLEFQREAGCDDKAVAAEFDEAIDALMAVIGKLSLL